MNIYIVENVNKVEAGRHFNNGDDGQAVSVSTFWYPLSVGGRPLVLVA
jgi:hypothetical protein